jgi:hypothetical protein
MKQLREDPHLPQAPRVIPAITDDYVMAARPGNLLFLREQLITLCIASALIYKGVFRPHKRPSLSLAR